MITGEKESLSVTLMYVSSVMSDMEHVLIVNAHLH